MKHFVVLLLLFFSGREMHSQNLYTISLEKFSLLQDSITFRISEVIDARKDQRVIGIVQLGLKNRKDLALFEKPGLQEIEGLLTRSKLISKEKGLTIRISKLYISEITQTWKEIAKAELSADFFISYKDEYYYIASVYTTVEPKGMDVTHQHPRNIVAVLQKALIQFSSKVNKINSEKAFTKEDLINPNLNFRDVSAMPIMQTVQYKEGYYQTFDEFVNNDPSLDIQCKVKLGANPRIKCGDHEQATSIYGYAKANELYVLFHHNFYLLEKRNNSFFFRGPREFSQKDVSDASKNWLVPRQAGDRTGHNAIYSIDVGTGSILNTTGF